MGLFDGLGLFSGDCAVEYKGKIYRVLCKRKKVYTLWTKGGEVSANVKDCGDLIYGLNNMIYQIDGTLKRIVKNTTDKSIDPYDRIKALEEEVGRLSKIYNDRGVVQGVSYTDMRVRCINNKDCSQLTVGKSYHVIDKTSRGYVILGNSGTSESYAEWRFEVVPDVVDRVERLEKIMEEAKKALGMIGVVINKD